MVELRFSGPRFLLPIPLGDVDVQAHGRRAKDVVKEIPLSVLFEHKLAAVAGIVEVMDVRYGGGNVLVSFATRTTPAYGDEMVY